MCYSAEVWNAYHRYRKEHGADISIKEFLKLYLRRQTLPVKIPLAMDAAFADPRTDEERQIKALIDEYRAEQTSKLQAELFAQRKRLADAERALQLKETKKASESRRIATAKVEAIKDKLAALQRREPVDEDSRIFPNWYAPVMIVQDGRRVVVPMRYRCRLPGWSPKTENEFPGTYNARRDKLEKSWGKLFGYSHGVVVVNRFYENVSRHAMEGRALREGENEENVVLEFNPRPAHDMLVACLWSYSKGWNGEPDFYSFAAITDEPPPEVAAAGHDRCIIPIKAENVEAWLNPDPRNLAELYGILDDRDRPYYEHRLAA